MATIVTNTVLYLKVKRDLKSSHHKPWLGGSVGYTLSGVQKGCRFDSVSGDIPRLQVQSSAGAYTRGNQWMFIFSLPLLSTLANKKQTNKTKVLIKRKFFFL